MKLSEIKPKGNFEEVLYTINKKADIIINLCHTNKTYNESLGKLVQFNLHSILSLEEGIIENDIWNIEEGKMCLLYAITIAIKLNITAHQYLNNIHQDYLQALNQYLEDKQNIFGKLIIITE